MMNLRLPEAPPIYDMGWGSALVRALSQVLEAQIGPKPLPRFVKARLPKAEPWSGCIVYLVDGTNNQHLIVSDGGAWRYPDGALV